MLYSTQIVRKGFFPPLESPVTASVRSWVYLCHTELGAEIEEVLWGPANSQ